MKLSRLAIPIRLLAATPAFTQDAVQDASSFSPRHQSIAWGRRGIQTALARAIVFPVIFGFFPVLWNFFPCLLESRKALKGLQTLRFTRNRSLGNGFFANFPCIFPCYPEFDCRDASARDWVHHQ